eukprot:gnl/Spiro4/9679_TR5141_c0_g1_i1.p2 gnl/Spiro4/9679_TR5141_c0_g1~~gnl/Spiro4/9679_TR5141_c0_g1_i1.p2  ORF type:complete len:196 (-),score=41.28 gnl/Spiro4/9679_TR5141_c0_g1_i1:72-596(-)
MYSDDSPPRMTSIFYGFFLLLAVSFVWLVSTRSENSKQSQSSESAHYAIALGQQHFMTGSLSGTVKMQGELEVEINERFRLCVGGCGLRRCYVVDRIYNGIWNARAWATYTPVFVNVSAPKGTFFQWEVSRGLVNYTNGEAPPGCVACLTECVQLLAATALPDDADVTGEFRRY